MHELTDNTSPNALTDGGQTSVSPEDLTVGKTLKTRHGGLWRITDERSADEGDIPARSIKLRALDAPNAETGHTEWDAAEEYASTIVDAYEYRDSNEVRHSDDEVRRYSADGHLYAYREGDKHVVVSRGNEPQKQWIKRVPAERHAVLASEHLWTIPDNFQHRVSIKGSGKSRYAIYHIPETDVDVLVTVPHKNHLVKAWYKVKRVGNLTVTYDDEIDWDELEDTIGITRDIEEVSEDVVEALERLHRRRQSFEREFAESVDMYAEEALFERAHEPVSVQEWTTDPWDDIFHVDDLVQDFLDLDDETLDSVLRELSEANIIPNYPIVRVDVEEDEGVPDGYEIRALVEAGASGAETIDYLITEHFDIMTQKNWSDIRRKGASAISKNVTGAKAELGE